MTFSTTARMRATCGLALVMALAAGCDQSDEAAQTTPENSAGIAAAQAQTQEQEQSQDQPGAATEIHVFSPPVREPTDVWANRQPAEPGRTILIPATTLFPGAARVDPQITNPYSGDPQAIAAGERHYVAYNCAGCHAPMGGGGMGPPLSDDDWIYGGNPEQIYLSIMHGRPEGMPAWASMLPSKTAWQIVAYVETLPQVENPAEALGFDENVGGFRNTREQQDQQDQQGQPGQGQQPQNGQAQQGGQMQQGEQPQEGGAEGAE